MDTDKHRFEQQRREGAKDFPLTHAEVFDEVGIFAEIRFHAELFHNDFPHADSYLVARPTGRGGVGQIGFVGHHPARKVADGLKFLGKFPAQRSGQSDAYTGGDDDNPNENENAQGCQLGAGCNRPTDSRRQRTAQQGGVDAARANQLGRLWDAQLLHYLVQPVASLLDWQQFRKSGGGSNLRPFIALMDQCTAQQIKRALGEANGGGGGGDFAEDEINQQARSDKFARLRIVNLDIEGIFDRHHKFNTVESHAGIVLSPFPAFNTEIRMKQNGEFFGGTPKRTRETRVLPD